MTISILPYLLSYVPPLHGQSIEKHFAIHVVLCPSVESASRLPLIEITPLGTAVPHGGSLTAGRGFCPSWSASRMPLVEIVPLGTAVPHGGFLISRPGILSYLECKSYTTRRDNPFGDGGPTRRLPHSRPGILPFLECKSHASCHSSRLSL